MTNLAVFFTSLILTFFLTPHIASLMRKFEIVDIPGGRRLHSEVIPSMGGLLISLIGLTVLWIFAAEESGLHFLLLSLLILIIFGILDDISEINSIVKFLIQNISSVLFLLYLIPKFSGVLFFGIIIPSPFNYILLHLFIVGALNAINLIDGLDGLLSGFSLLISALIFAVAIYYGDTLLIALSIALIGSIVGFLKFNAYPATIFLGDTGSLGLGFLLILVSILAAADIHPKTLDLTIPSIILALPIIDCIKVFILRVLDKRNPFKPDNQHIHYIFIKHNVKQKITVFFLELFTLLTILFAMLYIMGYSAIAFSALLAFGFCIFFMDSILSKFRSSTYLKFYFHSFIEIPISNITAAKRNFLIFLSSLMIIKIIYSFPVTSILPANELTFLLLTSIIFVGISLIQKKHLNSNLDSNVFISYAFFFVLSKFSVPAPGIINQDMYVSSGFSPLSFYSVLLILPLILVIKEKILKGNKNLFNGFDLTIACLIIISYSIYAMFQFDLFKDLSVSLLESFTLYIIYKIIVKIEIRTARLFWIFSFLLPLSALTFLLIAY